ncbi:MAG: DUF4174 domain-containing protein [Sphingomonas phyllosphaerae]
MMMPPLLTTLTLAAVASTSISALQWERRVLIVSAPSEQDASLRQQRLIMARWRAAAKDRDLHLVEIIGNTVVGVSDTSATLRTRYDVPRDRFAVVLIGKDGGTKLRQTRPIAAATLEETIDAMPMRRREVR